MRKNLWWAALAALAILLSACHNGGHAQNSTDMRAVNAVINSDPLDVVVAGDTKFTGLTYGSTSAFANFSSGSQEVTVRSTPTHAIFFDKSLNFGDGVTSTLVIYGSTSSISALQLTDDIASPDTPPASGNFKIRVVGASTDSGPVDLYVTPGTDLSNVPATLGGVTLGSASAYAETTAGSYVLTLTIAGTKDVLFQSSPMPLAAGAVYSILVLPSGGGKLSNALLLTQGQGGTGTLLSNPNGRVKAVNAIPDATPLDFLADGTPLLSNVPFAGASDYVPLASGSHTLQLEASNVPGSVIASLPLQVGAARDYTMVSVNSIAHPQLITFTDDNTAPPVGFAKLRFANDEAGSIGTDVLVNFASQVTNLASASASSYYTFAPSTTYTITFTSPGGISVLATLSPAELDAGGVYTAYLLGAGSSAQVRLVRDR